MSESSTILKREVTATRIPQGEALTARFNKGLAELKKDGTLVKLSQKWFGADFTK